jgi:hypothetical protein
VGPALTSGVVVVVPPRVTKASRPTVTAAKEWNPSYVQSSSTVGVLPAVVENSQLPLDAVRV